MEGLILGSFCPAAGQEPGNPAALNLLVIAPVTLATASKPLVAVTHRDSPQASPPVLAGLSGFRV